MSHDEQEPVLARLPWIGNDPWENPSLIGYPKVRIPGGPGPDDDLPCVGRWDLFDQDVATTEARRLCDACVFNVWCYRTAVANNEWGIWAGVSYDERRLLRKGNAA